MRKRPSRPRVLWGRSRTWRLSRSRVVRSARVTDVYALGCVLYECLVGEVPFAAESRFRLLVAHLQEPPPPRASEHNEDLPAVIDAVVVRALAKRPGERFGSCGELIEAARRALAADAPVPGLARLAVVRNPYKGLRAFAEQDSDDFFGREALTEELAERLAAGERFLAVVGRRGSGKSSAVSAGLLPLVRAGGVRGSERSSRLRLGSCPARPRPIATVAQRWRRRGCGLARGAGSCWWWSTSSRSCSPSRTRPRRARFIELLTDSVTAADAGVRVVVTLRADFYDRPLRVRGLSALVEDGHVAVHPLSPGELEAAITGPAGRAGLELEPGLVADIVADIVDQPGALPLLQHTLSEPPRRRARSPRTPRGHRIRSESRVQRRWRDPDQRRIADTVERGIDNTSAISGPLIRNRRRAAIAWTRSSPVLRGIDRGAAGRSSRPASPSRRYRAKYTYARR